jgi:autotransporter translocation and assembly factor TamB
VSDDVADVKTPPRKRAGCLRWLGRLTLSGLLFLVVTLVWLNGPGMRWLGPKVAAHFMEKAGMVGEMRLGGTLLGGVEVYDLEITSAEGALERVAVDRLVTDYRFREVIKGKVRGISGTGIHVDLRIVESEEEKEPLDIEALAKTLGEAREKFMPLALDLRDMSVSAKKEGQRVVEITGASLSHKPGDDLIELAVGTITDAAGRTLLSQKVAIRWEEGRLALGKLDLLPTVGVRNLELLLPDDGEISASGLIRVRGAVFKLDVGEGIREVRVDLVQGQLDFGNPLTGLGVGLPMKGRLTSLAVEVRDVFPDWRLAVGTGEAFVEGFSYDGWDVPEASVGVVIEEGKFSAKVAGKSFDSDVTVEGGGEFDRTGMETGDFGLRRIAGNLRIAQAGRVLRALDAKLNMPQDFGEFPDSEVSGKWLVDFGEEGFHGVAADLLMEAREADASPIRLDASFKDGVVGVKRLAADGMEFSGKYTVATRAYEARQILDQFDSARIAPWLQGAGITAPGDGVVSMKWEGTGILTEMAMRGEITDLDGTWILTDSDGTPRPPVSAKAAKITYNWPGMADVRGLVLETQGQTVKLDAKLANTLLTLEEFVWLDAEGELAKGRGTLPMPEDFSKLDEFLANDTRPLDLTLDSETLSLSKLRPWIPRLEQIDGKATGKIGLKIAGSLAKPEVDALVEIREVSVPGRSEVPTTDVTVKLTAREGRADISAEAVAADYAPATLKAEMAFLPRKWGRDPASLLAEEIKGTLDLPRIELSRFQSLIPGALELGGVTTGKVEIAGTIGDPKIDGGLNLSGGSLRLKGDVIPALSGIAFDMEANMKTVSIKGTVGDLAGGSININGTMQVTNAAGDGLGPMDVSVKGVGLPVMRNEFLILRANADLRVTGTMADALVRGEVGIIDSVFFKDIELLPIGRPFLGPAAASLPKVDAPARIGINVPAPFNEWTADIAVKTIDPILIRGNLGKGRVDAALRVSGKLGDPKPEGRMRITEAVARLPFSTLEVREGYLIFTPANGFDPTLEIRGTAEPRPYRVQIYAYGLLSDPQLVMTSEPPLPDNEIMTLLATGTTSAGLEDSQAASSRAMQLLIEELRRGRFLFGDRLRPVLGLLDNVDFSLAETDPYDSDSYSSATLKLNERWYITAGIGAQGDQRIMAIWRFRFR